MNIPAQKIVTTSLARIMWSWCVVITASIASRLLSSVDGFGLVLFMPSTQSLLSTSRRKVSVVGTNFVNTHQPSTCKLRLRIRQVSSSSSIPSRRRDNHSRCFCVSNAAGGNAAGEDETVSTVIHSRRHLLTSAISTTSSLLGIMMCYPQMASAKVVSAPISTSFPAEAASSSSLSSFIERRNALLRVISSTKSTEDDVLIAIKDLVPFGPLVQPSSSSSSSSSSFSSSTFNSALDGTWQLLWYNKADFSPLLQLPAPIRPSSYQYFGPIAEREVGPNRAAQGLVGGVVSTVFGKDAELWLSSGIGPSSSSSDESRSSDKDSTTLIIYPPFRLQLGHIPRSTTTATEDNNNNNNNSSSSSNNNNKRTIVESESDADFRKVNSRTVEAQNAPRNEYEQLYIENLGTGSLRISVITKGDPVIVGNMFIHQKL